MSMNDDGNIRPNGPEPSGGDSVFEMTQWSLVMLAAHRSSAESEQAMSSLCQAYYLPLYAYARRRTGDPEQARSSFSKHSTSRIRNLESASESESM